MDHRLYIEKLTGPSTLDEKIEAVHALEPFTDNPRVMNALCEAAVATTSYQLREKLIGALKSNLSGACMRFMDDALWSCIPSRRRWALMNLSLLNCRDAKAVVIRGLNDPHASVREAAAMNAGLYDDRDVLSALERYFETHRLDLTLSFIGAGVNALTRKNATPEDEDLSGRDADAMQSSFMAVED